MATFVCPACWKVTEVPDDMAGRRVRCPDCHAIGPAQSAAAPPPESRTEDAPALSAPPAPRPPEVRAPLPEVRPPADSRRVAALTAWAACLVWTLAVMVKYGWLMDTAESVVQQTALGVRACAWILGGYVVARAVHSLCELPKRG